MSEGLSGLPSFGALLRRLRQDAGLTQEDLAERAGISVRGLSDLERGVNRTARGETARLLADGFGLREDERRRFLEAARGFVPAAKPASPALPTPPTPLIGREREVAGLLALLGRRDLRLVTLTGAGGIGKTRLALEAAAWAAPRYPDGVWFVDLSPLSDAALTASAVAQALGVVETADSTIEESLVTHLERRRLLVLLDNFERVVAAASFVAALLARCPAITVFVTSRTPLHLPGEYEYPAPALELPDLARLTAVDDAQTEAVALFVARLRAVRADFRLTARNLEAVAEICVRLDGLPLAIELAAARGNVLSPVAMLALLDQRLAFLTGGPRDASPRQRTMRDAIAWSHDLLSEEETMLFRRLAVFVGGFTIEAAAWVAGVGSRLSAVEVLPDHPAIPLPSSDTHQLLAIVDRLASLIDWSLLQRFEMDGETRFRMLETVREYANDALIAAGDEGMTRRRHAAYFTALAEDSVPHLRSGDQRVWLDRLEREHDNFRASLAWALRVGDTGTAQRLCGALAQFWRMRGHLSEGRRWCAQALAAGGEASPRVRADALHAHGMLAHWQGDYAETEWLYEASLALRREIGDERGIALSLNSLGILADDVGDYGRASALHEESLRRWKSLGDACGAAHTLCDIGNVAKVQGREADAMQMYDQSLALFALVDDRHGMAMVIHNQGDMAMRKCAYAQAVLYFDEALAVQRALGYPQFIARLLDRLGTATLALGDIDRAEKLHQESLALQQSLGDRGGIATSLIHLGNVARARGDMDRVAMRYRESLRLRWMLGHKEGVAACLEALAVTRTRCPAEAAKLFGVAATLREAIGTPAPATAQSVNERGIAAARSRMGEAAFARAWTEGQAADLDDAIAETLEVGADLQEVS